MYEISGIVDVPETIADTAVPQETGPETEPETFPETQVPEEVVETDADYGQQLTDIHAKLDEIQVSLTEKLYTEYFSYITEKLDAIEGKLIEPVQVGDQLCYPYYLVMDPAAESETSETEPVISETLPPVDYTQDIQELITALTDVNEHLETVQLNQQNQQNIQIPMMCGIALIVGGILALICSNYIKH